jgi:hypothetical protein
MVPPSGIASTALKMRLAKQLANGGRVAVNDGNVENVRFDLDRDPLAECLALPPRLRQRHHFVDTPAEVHWRVGNRLAALAVELAQAPDDRGGVIGGGVDQLHVRPGGVLRHVGAPQEQLGKADDG